MSQSDGGDNSSYDRERQQLLDEFAAALRARHENPGSEPWFSEDDLVDVFDFAGDVGNDYLRAEALMWGARTFPESERLFERRGVFYSDVLSDKDVEEFTSANPGTVTFLTSLLDLRARNLGQEGTRVELERLMTEYRDLDDEEAIQLVNLAADTGNLDWMMDNLDMLRKKVQYESVLLYEIGADAVELNRPAYGEVVFSMLVEKEPYNADFWACLGQAQVQLGKFASASESVDMALAIDPSYMEAIQIKAQLLSKQTVPDPLPELKELSRKFPDNATIAQYYLERLCSNIRNFVNIPEEIVSEAGRLLEKFPDNSTIISYYVALTPYEHTIGYLDRMWKEWSGDDSMQHWREWAEFYLVNGLLNGTLAVVRTVLRNSPLAKTELMPELEAQTILCMLLQRWEETEQAAEEFRETLGALSSVISIALIYAQMHLHQYSKAYTTFEQLERNEYRQNFVARSMSRWAPVDALFDMGVSLFVDRFRWHYFTRNPKKADKFDPLHIFDFQ